MALCQIDFGKKVPYTPNPDGYYYWSSVYYVDDGDFVDFFDMANWANAREKKLCTEDVQFTKVIVKRPIGRGNVVYTLTWPFPQFGDLDSEGEYSLINVARARLYSASGRLSWRLVRLPLRPSDQDGDRLSASGHLWARAGINTAIASGRWRNSYGELITRSEVVWPLAMWQLRHGTKRRERNPFA